MKYIIPLLLATCALAKPTVNPGDEIILDKPDLEAGMPLINLANGYNDDVKLFRDEERAKKSERKWKRHYDHDHDHHEHEDDHEDHISREEDDDDDDDTDDGDDTDELEGLWRRPAV
ncbi:hypothetical protein TWF694_001106 [Orbilia ellipsospora]|uniref:Uncharacterized protein n=1 Tax=Orbilia ellipsospora TaxID=2528407 RepID=A0AAV9XR39_9PEZI